MKKEILAGLFLGAMVTGAFAQDNEGIFAFKAGQFGIYMLVESQRPGNAGILVGADEAILKRYIPASGFQSSTNAFLIKAPGQNILVDTGFGTALFDNMKKLGVEPEQVDAVLITHLHGDHIGGLQKDGKALLPNATIYLSSKEYDYFTKTNVNQGAVAALAPYGSRVITFEPDELASAQHELLPGIIPVAAYGHTPGHTIFLLQDGQSRFIIWGDLMHVELVQFPVPEISASYDTDPKAAAAVRRNILDYAAKNRIPAGGMHLVYPGMGFVEADGNGFKFIQAK